MLVRPLSTPPARIEDLLDAETLARLDRLDVVSRRVFAGKMPGERRSKARGQSVEFDDFRPYSPGDDLRHVDWHVLARLDRLVVKLFRAEEDLGVRLVIDRSASMLAGDPPKATLAARLAIALGYIGLVNSNRVSVATFGAAGTATGMRTLRPMRGRQNLARLSRFVLDALGEQFRGSVEATEGGASGVGAGVDLSGALTRVAMDPTGGPGLVVVISDFMDRAGYVAGLNALAARGNFDVVCAQTLAPGELDPAADAPGGLIGDLRLVDSESGLPAEVTVTTGLLKRYRERLDQFVGGLDQACRARGFTHLVVPSDADVGELIHTSLRRRGVLG